MSAPSQHMKTRLHNRVTGFGWPAPKYEVSGPISNEPAARQWLCVVRINGVEYGRGYGQSRQAASEIAAIAAYNKLIQEGF